MQLAEKFPMRNPLVSALRQDTERMDGHDVESVAWDWLRGVRNSDPIDQGALVAKGMGGK